MMGHSQKHSYPGQVDAKAVEYSSSFHDRVTGKITTLPWLHQFAV